MNQIAIKITDKCIYSSFCKFCPSMSRSNKDMSFDLFKKIIDENNPNSVLITGGEPLRHPDLKEFLNYIKDRLITIETSGRDLSTLIDISESYSNITLDVNNNGLDDVSSIQIKNLNKSNIVLKQLSSQVYFKDSQSLIKVFTLATKNINDSCNFYDESGICYPSYHRYIYDLAKRA